MLGVKTYDPAYVGACRARIADQLAAYDQLVASSKDPAAVAAFAGPFFANLVLVLEASFVHRLRGVEGKDGNPLNEVRMLADSILTNGGVLAANSTVKYKAGNAVLGIEVGEPIRIDRDAFGRLSEGYFAEIEARFT